jgi:hypothetical protein
MKRKNKFIIIGVIILIIFIFLIYKLLNLQSPISEKHIGIKFEIHNCSSVEKNSAELRENFLKPLLEFNIVQSKTETTENLYLPSVKCIDKTFCIPAIGINAIRYNSKTETLQESTMTSTSREGDQDAFFKNWNGSDNLSALEQNLLKSNPKAQQNPSLNEIKKMDKLDVIFIDSFIIDKNCSDQAIEDNKPYIFRSTRDLRNYINKELEKNPNALEKGTNNKTIHIFTYCGSGIVPVPIKPLNVEEQIDTIKGEQPCDGCPLNPTPPTNISDKGIADGKEHDDLTINDVNINSERKLTWVGTKEEIRISISIRDTTIFKDVKKNNPIILTTDEKTMLIQNDSKLNPIEIKYLDPNTKKYKVVIVPTGPDKVIHCYDIY